MPPLTSPRGGDTRLLHSLPDMLGPTSTLSKHIRESLTLHFGWIFGVAPRGGGQKPFGATPKIRLKWRVPASLIFSSSWVGSWDQVQFNGKYNQCLWQWFIPEWVCVVQMCHCTDVWAKISRWGGGGRQEVRCVDYPAGSCWQLTGVTLASTPPALIPLLQQEPKTCMCFTQQ